MSKKTLDVSGITNELEGASAFFPKRVSSPLPETEMQAESNTQREPQLQQPQPVYEAKNERPNVPPNESTNVQKPQRVKVRHTFDIFQDQLFALQSLQLEAVQRGKRKPKLGDMVQQAIDVYLRRKQRKAQKQRG